MKIRKALSLIIIAFFSTISSVYAAPITYDFTATYAPDLGPYRLISGSFTLDGSTVIGIDLTIGSYTYTSNEVGYLFQYNGYGNDLIGGSIDFDTGDFVSCLVTCVQSGTNDFMLVGNFAENAFGSFSYASPGVEGPPITHTGTITARAPTVPIPGSFFLLLSGLASLVSIRRMK